MNIDHQLLHGLLIQCRLITLQTTLGTIWAPAGVHTGTIFPLNKHST